MKNFKLVYLSQYRIEVYHYRDLRGEGEGMLNIATSTK